MKRIILVLALMIYAIGSFAQSEQSVTIGVRGGAGFSTFGGDFKKGFGVDESKSKFLIGYAAGISVDIPVWKQLSVQTGIWAKMKGAKLNTETRETHEPDSYKGTWVRWTKDTKDNKTYNATYIQIPILVTYRHELSEKMHIEANLGPYFAYGIGGKYKGEHSTYTTNATHSATLNKTTYSSKETSSETESDFFGDIDIQDGENKGGIGIKRFDWGVSLGVGFTYNKKYYIGCQYDLGMADMIDHNSNAYKDAKEKYSLKNRNLSVVIGYNF